MGSRMNIKNHRNKNGRRRNDLRVHTNMGGGSRLLRDRLYLFRRRAWPPPCRKGYIFIHILHIVYIGSTFIRC